MTIFNSQGESEDGTRSLQQSKVLYTGPGSENMCTTSNTQTQVIEGSSDV